MSKERWAELLTDGRLGKSGQSSNSVQQPDGRTEFDRDYGRLIFSSHFRRLQDKTQVFPLAKSDHTHTRLTHTLEVANVGATLGKVLGHILKEKTITRRYSAFRYRLHCQRGLLGS